MAHHRCTRCKEESEVRYKYKRSGVAGVFCLPCLRIVRGEGGISTVKHDIFNWFGSIWDRIADFATSVFRRKSVKRVNLIEERASYTRLKAMQMRARSIQPNPQGAVPQKA